MQIILLFKKVEVITLFLTYSSFNKKLKSLLNPWCILYNS